MENAKRVVCLCSGGLDSSVVLAMLRKEGWTCIALFVDYGQVCAAEERHAFEAICQRMDVHGIAHHVELWPREVSALLGAANKPLFLPHRNMVLLIRADLLAAEFGANALACGLCSTQAYPDSSRAFIALVQQCLSVSGSSSRTILAPLIGCDKAAIGALAAELDVPVELTFSCHRGGEGGCGACPGCADRKRAMEGFYASRS